MHITQRTHPPNSSPSSSPRPSRAGRQSLWRQIRKIVSATNAARLEIGIRTSTDRRVETIRSATAQRFPRGRIGALSAPIGLVSAVGDGGYKLTAACNLCPRAGLGRLHRFQRLFWHDRRHRYPLARHPLKSSSMGCEINQFCDSGF